VTVFRQLRRNLGGHPCRDIEWASDRVCMWDMRFHGRTAAALP
jgi:hypothetical protein